MTCEQCNEWLGDAVDGTLDAERQTQVDAHCRTCAACRELLDDLRQIRAAAATLDRRTPSPELWHAIAAKVSPASPKPPADAVSPLWRGRQVWLSLQPPPRWC